MAGDRAGGVGSRFVALLPAAKAVSVAAADLDAMLLRALEAGHAAWPDVALSDAEFLAHIAVHVGAADAALTQALEELHAADLYLACACARGDARALAHFDEHFMAQVGRTWTGSHRLADFVDEARQALRVRLLVSDDGGPPRIATYAGRGPLAGWVRMAATRLALNLSERERPHRHEDDDDFALRAPGNDPELEYMKTRYAAELNEAMRNTIGALPSRDANVLRLHYQDGMAMDAIGTMYRVSGRTVQRWLADARHTILAEARRLLHERLGLSDPELDSLIGLVRSRLDVRLSQLFRARVDVD